MHRALQTLQTLQIYNFTTSFYPLLLEYLLYITTLVTTTPYLPPKCLLIVYFVPLVSSITLLLTLYQTAKELYIKPINPIALILFNPFLLTILLTLCIGEKKKTVLITTFSGPSAAYKPNYSHYCFRYCFCRCFFPYTTRIDLAATPYINLAATTRINLAVTTHINLAYYSPPYRGAVRLQSYYRPPYYRAARSWSYKYYLQLLYRPILDG